MISIVKFFARNSPASLIIFYDPRTRAHTYNHIPITMYIIYIPNVFSKYCRVIKMNDYNNVGIIKNVYF